MIWNRGRGNETDLPVNLEAQDCCCASTEQKHHSKDCALSCVGKGCRCRIRRHHGQGAVRQRLLDMGFIPETEVEVLRVATLGDPMEVRVGDSCITLRKCEAEQIEIAE